MAYATALNGAGVLTENEKNLILAGLKKVFLCVFFPVVRQKVKLPAF